MAAKKISWKSLEHHAGAAVKVPEWVKSLSTSADYLNYCSELEGVFVQEGQSCTAAAPAISLLLDHVAESAQPEWVLRVVANIAGSDQLWGWLREPASIPADVGQVLFDRRAELFAALGSDSAKARSAAAFVLGVAPTALISEAIERLSERLSNDSSEHVVASCLLALARLSPGDTKGVAARLSTHASALVRGAAAVALIPSSILRHSCQAFPTGWARTQIPRLSRPNFGGGVAARGFRACRASSTRAFKTLCCSLRWQ